jgi:hypothetical protein
VVELVDILLSVLLPPVGYLQLLQQDVDLLLKPTTMYLNTGSLHFTELKNIID